MTSKSFHRKGSKNVYSHCKGGNGASFKNKTSHRKAGLLLPAEVFQKQEEEAQPLTHQATMEESTPTPSVNPQLLSFLQKDDSFLCPWNWCSNASQEQNAASCSAKTTMHQNMQFQPGSFFATQVV